jgi:hypothetical protein
MMQHGTGQLVDANLLISIEAQDVNGRLCKSILAFKCLI